MGSLSGRHVLVVDDDAMVRFIVATELEDAGASIAEAPDGATALAALGGGAPFDLLVTDIRMPGIDGWRLAERARELRPSLPVLYVTGWSDDAARPVPCSTIVAKPFKPRQLVDAAANLIGQEGRTG